MKLQQVIGASVLSLFVSTAATAEEIRHERQTEVVEVEVEIEKEKKWHIRPVASLRGGLDYAKVGGKSSKVFLDPDSTSRDEYIPTDTWHTAGLWGALLGIEMPIYSPDFRWQTGVSYYGTSNFHVKGNITEGADLTNPNYLFKSYEYKVRNTRVLWENKFFKAITTSFDVYFLAGIGWSQNKAFNYKEYSDDERDFPNSPFQDKTTNSFTYSFGAGIEMALTNHIRIGLGYQYSDLGKVALDSYKGQPTDESIEINHSPAQELVANITYIF